MKTTPAAIGTQVCCRICGAETAPLGIKHGAYERRDFELRRCPECRFAFIANPWTDYERIYSADYYAGRGADPMVDYVFELEEPHQTIRVSEWRGILRLVRAVYPLHSASRWLDFGCGNGGLVRYLAGQGACEAIGYEEGWIAGRARANGIRVLRENELDSVAGACDVVTAIEVLEHIEDPVAALRRMRGLLKPGGLLFFTTSNARPARDRLLSWPYVIPEIHISFFEPETAARALRAAGFTPEFRGFLPGFADIIRFKALKNLGVRKRARWQSLLPWSILARVLDARFEISAHPIGWAREPN